MIMKFQLRRVLLTASLGAACAAVFFPFTGMFIVPRYELETSCDTCVLEGEELYPQTVWYWRKGTGYPFVSSDGGNLMRLKEEGYEFSDRLKVSVEIRKTVFRRKMAAFPYSESLYKITTGGRPPKKYDSVF